MKKSTSGFTIVELLVVIVVIAILATISVVGYNGIRERANLTAAQATLRDNFTKIAMHQAAEGSYPINTANSLQSLGLNVNKNAFHFTNNGFVYCTSADRSKAALLGRLTGSTEPVAYSSNGGFTRGFEWGSSMNARCNTVLGETGTLPFTGLNGTALSSWSAWTGPQ